MEKKNQKNSQNAKKSNFFVRTTFQPDFLLVKKRFWGAVPRSPPLVPATSGPHWAPLGPIGPHLGPIGPWGLKMQGKTAFFCIKIAKT